MPPHFIQAYGVRPLADWKHGNELANTSFSLTLRLAVLNASVRTFST